MIDNEIITSRDNAKLKLARSVRDGREHSLIFVEGLRLVRELLASDLDIFQVYVSSELADTPKYFEADENAKRPNIIKVAANLFPSISDTENSQGIVALAERPSSKLDELSGENDTKGPIALLHKANNPANLGAVVRTAEAAGSCGVITTNNSADAYSPKAIRASMGSCFRLPIVEGIEFQAAIDWAKSNNLITTAADIDGPLSYYQTDWTRNRLLIFGSEAHGLSREELGLVDEAITIPMNERVESLNLAVSSGIILFEAKRQRN